MVLYQSFPFWACLLLSLSPPVNSQVPTPDVRYLQTDFEIPLHEWTQAATPFTTITGATAVSTWYQFPVETTVTATASEAEATYTFYNGLHAFSVSWYVGLSLDAASVPRGPVCSFPISGIWSLFPRIVFWASIIFALVARSHEWLIGGALAAALTFSSLAALQVSFQVWTHGASSELDFIPIMGILAGSCIMAVPLMNWSKTIQRLGLDKHITISRDEAAEDRHKPNVSKKDYGSTRTILVLWNLLVTVGFLAAFVGIQPFIQHKDADNQGTFRPFLTPTTGNITCVPDNGSLDPTAGQLFGWKNFWVTSEFLDANHCVDLCQLQNWGTLFRSKDELKALDMKTVDRLYEQQHTSELLLKYYNFGMSYYKNILWVVPFIILQGLLQVVFFWRTSPQRARREIYILVSRISTKKQFEEQNQSTRSRAGFWLAFVFYLCAVATIPLAAIGFVINLVVTEVFLTALPQSETNDHVDQWGVFAILILLLIAALISRLEPGTRTIWRKNKLIAKIHFVKHQMENRQQHEKQSCNNLKCFKDWPESDSFKMQFRDLIKSIVTCVGLVIGDIGGRIRYRINDIKLALGYEWFLVRQFWQKPWKKPQRREKFGPKDANGQSIYYAREPKSKSEIARHERERDLAKLEKDLKTAKDILKRRFPVEDEIEFESGLEHDQAPLLQNSQPVSRPEPIITPPMAAHSSFQSNFGSTDRPVDITLSHRPGSIPRRPVQPSMSPPNLGGHVVEMQHVASTQHLLPLNATHDAMGLYSSLESHTVDSTLSGRLPPANSGAHVAAEKSNIRVDSTEIGSSTDSNEQIDQAHLPQSSRTRRHTSNPPQFLISPLASPNPNTAAVSSDAYKLSLSPLLDGPGTELQISDYFVSPESSSIRDNGVRSSGAASTPLASPQINNHHEQMQQLHPVELQSVPSTKLAHRRAHSSLSPNTQLKHSHRNVDKAQHLVSPHSPLPSSSRQTGRRPHSVVPPRSSYNPDNFSAGRRRLGHTNDLGAPIFNDAESDTSSIGPPVPPK